MIASSPRSFFGWALPAVANLAAAPIVVAKGAGLLAQRIRRMALENDIPIVERKDLARALYKDVEVNQAIPAEQYTAVAELLKYVYELKGIQPPTPANVA